MKYVRASKNMPTLVAAYGERGTTYTMVACTNNNNNNCIRAESDGHAFTATTSYIFHIDIFSTWCVRLPAQRFLFILSLCVCDVRVCMCVYFFSLFVDFKRLRMADHQLNSFCTVLILVPAHAYALQTSFGAIEYS